MKHLVKFLLIFFFVAFSVGCDAPTDGGCGTDGTDATDGEVPGVEAPAQLAGVKQYIQATVRIEGDITVYFDPYQFPGEPHDADVIFITHSHADHFSPDDIAKVSKADTILVVPESMAPNVANLGMSAVQTVMPGSQYSVKGVSFETTAAYNPGSFVRHPKSNNWVGYIVTMGDTRYYVAGDTNFVPEMESVTADVVFLPAGGGSSMDAEEAATAAAAIGPAIAVPIHYGVTPGSGGGAAQFVELLPAGIAGYIYSDDGELLP